MLPTTKPAQARGRGDWLHLATNNLRVLSAQCGVEQMEAVMANYPIILNGDQAAFEAEHADTPAHERPDWPLPSFDARDWAKAFLAAYERGGDNFLSVEVMVGWFANALMRGFDEGVSRCPPTTGHVVR